jgi:hypothetical protein
MADMNLGGAGAASAGADALQQLLARLAAEHFRTRQQEQEQQRIGLEQQRANDESEWRRMNAESLADQRQQLGDVRATQRATTITGRLRPRAEISDATGQLLEAGGLGDTFRREGASPGTPEIPGVPGMFMDMPSTPKLTGRLVYQGTPEQQHAERLQTMLDQIAADPNTAANVRLWAQTGARGAPPAPVRATQRVVAPGGYVIDDSGKVLFHAPDRSTEAERNAGRDDPSLPRGVQDYIGQLTTKHPDFTAARADLVQTWPQITAAHPHASQVKAIDALRRGFAQPGGSGLDSFINGIMAGSVGGGRGGGPAGAGGQTPVRVAGAQVAGAGVGTTVRMRAPNGMVKDIPADQVEHYKGLGAKVVQ